MKYNLTSGRKLYLILWGGTLFITIAAILFGNWQEFREKRVLKIQTQEEQQVSERGIDGLLLSSNDLTLAEKKSFISLYLKPGEDIETSIYREAKQKHKEVYKQIFQRKLARIKTKSTDNFFVGPLPK